MDPDALTVARRSLHAVAEMVLAGPQYRATGRLRLRVVPGGFATAFDPAVRVQGSRVLTGQSQSQIGGQSVRTLGERLGLAAGPPDGAYRDGCGIGIDDPLELHREHADAIIDALALGNAALARLAPAETPVLWPEHFDVAIRVGDVNYGVSPGDAHLAEPYAYVGPGQVRRATSSGTPPSAPLAHCGTSTASLALSPSSPTAAPAPAPPSSPPLPRCPVPPQTARRPLPAAPGSACSPNRPRTSSTARAASSATATKYLSCRDANSSIPVGYQCGLDRSFSSAPAPG
ncbi:MAG TPA: hypothetical protein VMG38_00255 [Trebonia sp.]|nr:hypothetical protein [Trebonia sp.]